MRRIVTCGLSGSTNFPYYLTNGKLQGGGEELLNMKILLENFLILRRFERDMINNVYYNCLLQGLMERAVVIS
jgi:hypothetical protein